MKLHVPKLYVFVCAGLALWWALDMVRWSRWEEYDQKSPDGRYSIRVYGDIFHFSMTIGGGADRKAKVELVENATGRVLDSGRLPILWMVRDTFWYEDCVEVTRGDEGLLFQLPAGD